jgi:hypothetical protein
MEGLRGLVANLATRAARPSSGTDPAAAREMATASQQILDLLVMSEDAPGSSASGSGGAQDPGFCTPGFRSDALHPGLPWPYGEFAANAAVNFCMPNGPYGNDLRTVVPDQYYVFDFRRACYQHDMGYFWTPAETASTPSFART